MKRYTVEKDWDHTGLKCVVIMGHMGFRCGYVGISKEHPLYGVKYSDNPDFLKPLLEKVRNGPVGERGIISILCWDGESVSPEILFSVHGGITYSDGGVNSDYPIQSDLWWFGYDCGHAGDNNLSLEYCCGECEQLAEQLIELV